MTTFRVYLLPFIFIATWWGVAFWKPPQVSYGLTFSPDDLPFQSDVTPIDRSRLFRALNGDFELMIRMMLEWDLEAQILMERGVQGIERLDRKTLLNLARLDYDDEKASSSYFFPQTYLAAGILLSLVNEEQITCLPKGLRDLPELYDERKMQKIGSDAEAHSLETVGNPSETIAFVSPYSEPCTLHALHKRGMPIVNLGAMTTFGEIKESIRIVGAACQAPKKAQLLSFFVDAAFVTFDNHLKTRKRTDHKVLYVKRYGSLSAPTSQTLVGHLLKRWNINSSLLEESVQTWSIPLDTEDIAAINPECLICVSPHPHPLDGLQRIDAVEKGQVFFVDQSAQETSSQHFLLGCYDLYTILMRLP